MTINIADNDPRVSYAVAEGVTQTSFTVTFEFFDDADLNVYVDGTLKTLTTDYTVSGGDGSTGSVTISVTGASGGSTVVITRDIALERTTDFPASGAFQINSLNTELDRLTAIAADLSDKADRSLQLTDYDTAVSLVLPDVDTRKGKTLAFNESTGAVESGPSITDVQTVSAASADIATLADIEDGTDATDAIQTVAGISANVTTVAGVAANVTTVAGISSDVTAVAADATDIGTVSTNIANVNTVATNIANVNTVAGQTTNLQNVTDNLTAIQNAESNATSASDSAIAAAESQTAAAASAASAANSYDQFDDRYLGTKTSDPTVDNDGNALVSGALYFNNTENEMRVYDGGSWIAASSAGGASLLMYEYTATSGQTTFSGSDDNANTLSYTLNNIIVTLNGITLDPSDYTATSGTSIVLASGAALNDELNVVAFKSFTTADMVSATNGGTFGNDITVTGTVTADGLTVDGDAVIQDATPTLEFKDTDNNLIASIAGASGSLLLKADTGNGASGESMQFHTGGTERLRIDSDGNVGIGTSPSDRLHVFNGSSGVSSFAVNTDLIIEDSGNVGLQFASPNTNNNAIYFSDPESNAAGVVQYSHSTDEMSFDTNGITRIRITSDGDLLVGTTDANVAINNGTGVVLQRNGTVHMSRTGSSALRVNRQQDGALVNFYSAGSSEGSITVSGTTVSYNGGHLARWSRLTDDSKDTSIVKGTVMTNLDEMVEWGDEANEQLNKMAVSSVEGDANVAGVFVNWDEDDDWNDMNIAMTGDMVIRIASGTTVARGDLLMSAGDGTAKPQGDDIVRSKTIAKVISTHVSHTYDDGSYLVPCVLMAC